MAIYVKDVVFGNFEEEKIRLHGDEGDFSLQLLYREKPLVIQTDYMDTLFGLLEYKYPFGTLTNYSIAIKLPYEKDMTKPENEMTRFLMQIDTSMKDFSSEQITSDVTEYVYDSPLRAPKFETGAYHVRVKIPANKTNLKFDLYNGDELIVHPKIEVAREFIKHGISARFIMEMKNIWYTTTGNGSKKYGYSWQLQALQIKRNSFN